MKTFEEIETALILDGNTLINTRVLSCVPLSDSEGEINIITPLCIFRAKRGEFVGFAKGGQIIASTSDHLEALRAIKNKLRDIADAQAEEIAQNNKIINALLCNSGRAEA